MKIGENIALTFYGGSKYFSSNNELGIYVNRHKCTPNDIIGYHWHDFYELEFIVEGEALHTVNDKTCRLNRGDVYLVTSEDFHSLDFQSPNVELMCVAFIPRAIPTYLMEKISKLGFSSMTLTDHQYKKLYDELVFLYEQYKALPKMPDSFLLKNAFERVILLFLYYMFPNGITEQDEKHVQPIQRALAFIRENYSRQITLEDAAKAAGMESTYFSRYFKQKMNQRFVPYLNKVRCSVAEVFLSSTEMTVEQIALTIGYTSSSYFSKVFNGIYGQSPASYRQQSKDEQSLRGEKVEKE